MPIKTLVSAVQRWVERNFATGDELRSATTVVEDGQVKLLDLTVSTDEGGGSFGNHSEELRTGFAPEIGKEYRVTFDGVEYTATAFEYEYRSFTFAALGADDIYCGGGVPFQYLWNPDTASAYLYSNTMKEHRLIVGEDVVTVKRLADAFNEIELLRQDGPVFTVEFESPNGVDVECRQSFAEIAKAVEGGKNVDARLFIDAYGGQHMLYGLAEYYPGSLMRFASATVQEGFASLQGIELASDDESKLVGSSKLATDDELSNAVYALDSRLSAIESTPNAEGVSF